MKDKVTIHTLKKLKQAGQKICMVTAYDATFARILDDAGADVLLVGDSLGMVVQGNDSTLPVTMDQMVYHCRAVSRGAKRAHVVGDLPFMSYQASRRGGGAERRPAGRRGRRGQREARGRRGVRRDRRARIVPRQHPGDGPPRPDAAVGAQDGRLRGAGPRRGDRAEASRGRASRWSRPAATRWCSRASRSSWREQITARLSIPTIGIGAGVHCDGQVLVCYDLLGMNPDFKPKFVKRYADLYGGITRRGARPSSPRCAPSTFPDEEHSFTSQDHPAGARRNPRAPRPRRRRRGDEKVGPIYGVPV